MEHQLKEQHASWLQLLEIQDAQQNSAPVAEKKKGPFLAKPSLESEVRDVQTFLRLKEESLSR